jgi:hypothetical protein
MTEPESTTPAPIPYEAIAEPVMRPIDDPVMTPPPVTDPVPHHDAPNRGLVIIGVILFLLLACGEAALFYHQGNAPDESAAVAALDQQVNTLNNQVASLQTKLAATDGKVANLANQPAPAAPAPQIKVEDKIPPALGQQVNGYGDQIKANGGAIKTNSDLIKSIQANVASLSTTTLADHADLATLQGKAADLPKLIARAQTLAGLAQASIALQNGAPLGTIAGAPEALVRYATAAPPTLAGLQSSFPAYARKAERDGGDVAASGGFWQRVKGRVESMVTIRKNAHVLVGSRAAGILGATQADLDRDDLAAALNDLKPLPDTAKAAMTPWIDQATQLIAARTALASMAAPHDTAGSH